MNLSRRLILIAILVIASAVSLGLAGTAKATSLSELMLQSYTAKVSTSFATTSNVTKTNSDTLNSVLANMR